MKDGNSQSEIKGIKEKYDKLREKVIQQKEMLISKIRSISKSYGKKLSKQEKNTFIKKVNQTSKNKLAKISYNEKKEIKRILSKSGSKFAKKKKVGSVIVGGIAAGDAIKFYRDREKRIAALCKHEKTKAGRDRCILNVRKDLYERKLLALKDLFFMCKRAENKEICQLRVQGYIFKTQDYLNKIRRKLLLSKTGMYGE